MLKISGIILVVVIAVILIIGIYIFHSIERNSHKLTQGLEISTIDIEGTNRVHGYCRPDYGIEMNPNKLSAIAD